MGVCASTFPCPLPDILLLGLTSAVKNMLSSDDTADRSVGSRGSFSATNTQDSTFVGDRSSYQLPPGTGPGTSGKPAVLSELAMQNDLERSKTGQDTAGYGTDAAAAMGGTLAGTHQGGGSFHGMSHPTTAFSVSQTL